MAVSPAKTTLVYVMESSESQDCEARSGPKNMPSAVFAGRTTGLEEKRVCDVMLTHDGFTANFRTKFAKERNIGNNESPKPAQMNFHVSENSSSSNQDDGDDNEDGFTSLWCCCMKMVPRRGKQKVNVSYVKTEDCSTTVGCSTTDRNASTDEQ